MEAVNLLSPEFDLFSFFEMTPDLVCIAGKDGYFRKVNPSVMSLLGYTQEELFSRPISSFIHPDDRDITSSRRAALLRGKPMLNFENRYVTKKGEALWLVWTSIYLPDKDVVFAIAKDITERKRIEKEVEEKYNRFKNLASHFKASIEEDRKYLAIELHEELAQLASVVKMDLDWISTNAPDLPTDSKSRFDHAMAITGSLINTIRRISFSISPHMLDDLGLNATLEWYCKEFSILNGIPCHYQTAYDEADLNHEIRIDFFRICQEALANIMYHAEAGSVIISIEEIDNTIQLSIEDNGKGFDMAEQKQTPGIIRMRERAASINGTLNVETDKGMGTRICVTITKH
jgi:PAS domain S-box-containing protein